MNPNYDEYQVSCADNYQVPACLDPCQQQCSGCGELPLNINCDEFTPSIGPASSLGPGPGEVICYRCEEPVRPEMDMYPTAGTHAIVFVLAIFGLALFMFLPYILNWCARPVQRCPNCGAFLTEPSTRPLTEPKPLH